MGLGRTGVFLSGELNFTVGQEYVGMRLNEQNKISQTAPPSLYMKCNGVSPDMGLK